MSDIVERLRRGITLYSACLESADKHMNLLSEAADEIESLRQQLAMAESNQQNIEATHKLTLREVQRETMRLQTANDMLKQRLAEKDVEIGVLSETKESIWQALKLKEAQLAASQLREHQLRLACESALSFYSKLYGVCLDTRVVTHHHQAVANFAPAGLLTSALTLQQDTTALDKLKACYEAQIQQLLEAIDGHINPCGCFAGCEFCDNDEKLSLEEALALAAQTDTTALEAMIAEAGEVMRKRCAGVIGPYGKTRYLTSYEEGCEDTRAGIDTEIREIPNVTLEDLK